MLVNVDRNDENDFYFSVFICFYRAALDARRFSREKGADCLDVRLSNSPIVTKRSPDFYIIRKII